MIISNDGVTNKRADVLLAEANTDYSRAALAKLFDMGQITIDGLAIKAGDKIKPGVKFDAEVNIISKPADDIDIPIIYEDDNVVVVDKPSGVISHARGRYWDEASVASFVRSRVKDLSGERAGIVHRLDRATSGVMICAKNSETLSFLQKQFSNRKVSKNYIAIVKGSIQQPKGIIDIPIARNQKDPKRFLVDNAGKSAQTEYYIIASNDTYSMVKLHPLTGRTHQLRVHLQYLKSPILGDDMYGGPAADRLMLHAVSLEITIPGGVRKIFDSPLPDEFNSFIES